MNVKLRPYLEYKETGVPWLGKVPRHWRVYPLRRVASVQLSNVDKHTREDEFPVLLCNYIDVYRRRFITPELEFMRASAVQREIDKFSLRRGDVLITKDSELWTDIAVPAFVTADMPNTLCGYHLAQIRPFAGSLVGEYLSRAFQADAIAQQFRVAAKGVTRFGLSYYDIVSGLFTVPPIGEQRSIAIFLNQIDRRISRIIRAKRRQIELLNEQKQAIMSRAVTRGLDSNVRLKPSGLDWLGDIPYHWEPTRLKYVADVQTGVTLGKKYGDTPLETRPYLRVANVQDGHLELADIATVSVSQSEVDGCGLRNGDVLMTEGGDIDKLGRGCIWRNEIPGCLHQNHIFAVRARRAVLLPEYLVLAMSSVHGRSYFEMTAKQTTNLASTNSTTLKALPLFLPGMQEQTNIVGYAAEQTSGLETAVQRILTEVDLLREYRTRLIADVVTGKLDVRDVELPDLEDADIAYDLGDSGFNSDTDQDDLPDAEEVEADDED